MINERSDLLKYLFLERYVNDGSPSGFSSLCSISSKYLPSSTDLTFKLPLVFVEDAEFISYTLNEFNFSFLMENGKFLLPIHPDVLKGEEKILKELNVSPTASIRTVLDIDNKYFLKLNYDGKIGRAPRFVGLFEIEKSLKFNGLIDNLADELPTYFGFLPEVGAIYSKEYNIGCILRGINAKPYIAEEREYIPFFSLISDKPEAEILFDKILINYDSKRLMLEDLLSMLYGSNLFLTLKHGISIEQHAQNTLLEVNFDYLPRRIIFRDFLDGFVDNTIRKNNNLSLYDAQFSFSLEKNGLDDYYKLHSLLFDFKFCGYLVKPLLDKYSDYSGEKMSDVIEFSKMVLHKVITSLGVQDEFKSYFGVYDKTFKYPSDENIFVSGKRVFVEGGPPVLR